MFKDINISLTYRETKELSKYLERDLGTLPNSVLKAYGKLILAMKQRPIKSSNY